MKCLVSVASRLLLLLSMCFLSAASLWASSGIFRGTLVDPPSQADAHRAGKFLFLQSRNGSVRKVEISKANFAFDESVPTEQRKAHPQDSLRAGTDVRVTAEQTSDGEWHATLVEILGDSNSFQMSAPDDDGNEDDVPDADAASRAVLKS